MPNTTVLYDRDVRVCDVDLFIRGERETIKSRTGVVVGLRTAVTLRLPVSPDLNVPLRYEICEGGSRRAVVVFDQVEAVGPEAGFVCRGHLLQ